MAKITLGPLIQDIRGKLVNQVFSVWKAGTHYVRMAAAVISNPQSVRQAEVRERAANLSGDWFGLLGQPERLTWELIGSMNPRYRAKSNGIRDVIPYSQTPKISGQNAYVQTNAGIEDAGGVKILIPAIHSEPPPTVTNLAWAYLSPTGTFTWTKNAVHVATQFLRLWLVSRENTFHKQLLFHTDVTLETQDVTTVRGADGGNVALVAFEGDEFLFQADVVDSLTGWGSVPTATVEGNIS